MSVIGGAKKLFSRSKIVPSSPAAPIIPSTAPLSAERAHRKITWIVIGCGQRGKVYSRYALKHPELCSIVAFAEPRSQTRTLFAKQFNITDELAFSSWEALLEANQSYKAQNDGRNLADAVVVAVADAMHFAVVSAFVKEGFDILCEKPLATSIRDCVRIANAVNAAGVVFGCGHDRLLKQLGDLVNVVHIEPVGYFHFAHSYVRGNWNKEATSSFSLMTKSCHDIDVLCHWFKGEQPTRVSSFGSLSHFRKQGKPPAAGNATRCLDCPAEQMCAYSAKKIYLDPMRHGNSGWPVDTIIDGIPDIENVTEALKTTPYGLCVYESENDVVDHQVVNIEFANGATASFTMVAFTSLICQRQSRLHFTHGEIVGDGASYTVTNFTTGDSKKYYPASGGGHGGGDLGLSEAFVKAVAENNQNVLGTDVNEVLKHHLMVFAAEKSRRDGVVVDCVAFEQDVRAQVGTA
ncbi:NAD(P)-binding protein [Auriculariales sp. MPI-PUGE-AT-0066]|nr:NAD(P)-binding protein [Auriculariales sp. MPI-PUGE-AT-0066]